MLFFFKGVYTKASSMTENQEEPEVPAHKGDFNIVSLTETVGKWNWIGEGLDAKHQVDLLLNCFMVFAI